MSKPVKKTDAKKALQEKHRAWIKELQRSTGLKLTPLATNAGLGETTLTRLFKDDYHNTLSNLVIQALCDFYKVPGPDEYFSKRHRSSLGFGTDERSFANFEEGELIDPSNSAAELEALWKILKAGRTSVEPWRLKARALEMAGYLPGDLLVVDTNGIAATARAGDVVCAKVMQRRDGSAETVFRLFDPPFLVAAALEAAAFKPLLVDNDRVMIKGVVVGSARPWRAGDTPDENN